MSSFDRVLCALAFVGAPSFAAAQGGTIFREDFESGAPGWSFGGIWHVESDSTPCGVQLAPFPSQGHCAWYGALSTVGSSTLCDYSTGFIGSVMFTSTPIQLPSHAGSIALRYRRALQTEQCVNGYDSTRVRVTTNGGNTQLIVATDCASEPGWTDRRVDLSAFSGTSIQLHFEFMPNDNNLNETLGWWIDDIEIAAEPGVVRCTAAPDCACPQQWNSPQPTNGGQPNEDSGGCKHGQGKEARLFGNGAQSVSADTVRLIVHDLPASTVAMFVQGMTTPQSVAFGDGKRCLGSPFVRLGLHVAGNGQDAYPQVGETAIAQKGAVPPAGASRTYQVVFRDAATYCTPAVFNTSNAYVIAWRP